MMPRPPSRDSVSGYQSPRPHTSASLSRSIIQGTPIPPRPKSVLHHPRTVSKEKFTPTGQDFFLGRRPSYEARRTHKNMVPKASIVQPLAYSDTVQPAIYSTNPHLQHGQLQIELINQYRRDAVHTQSPSHLRADKSDNSFESNNVCAHMTLAESNPAHASSHVRIRPLAFKTAAPPLHFAASHRPPSAPSGWGLLASKEVKVDQSLCPLGTGHMCKPSG